MSDHDDVPGDAPSRRAGATGIAEGLTLSDMARPRIRNKSAILVAIAVGIALFVLVASAFSVGAESRVVAAKSNQLHSFDQVLRSASTARLQLGTAVQYSLLDLSANTDTSPAIDAAAADAASNIEELEISTDALPGESDVKGLVAEFSENAERILTLLSTGDQDDLQQARSVLTEEMDDTYGQLIGDLLEEREQLVSDLVDADQRLGSLGALATFVIAFFVPTVAMFVYRQITRRQRETIELARLLSDARAGTDWRADLIGSAAAMADEAVDVLPASSMTASLRSRLQDLSFLVGASTLGQRYTFESLTVSEIRETIRQRWPNLVSVAGAGTDIMWGDRDAIVLLCNDIVRNAHARGAERVLVSGGLDSEGVWLAITDNGRQIDQDAVKAILESPSLIDATDEHLARRLDPDTSLMLIMGRMIAPALGGSFWSDSVGSNTRCTLRLPAVKGRKSTSPKLVTAR